MTKNWKMKRMLMVKKLKRMMQNWRMKRLLMMKVILMEVLPEVVKMVCLSQVQHPGRVAQPRGHSATLKLH